MNPHPYGGDNQWEGKSHPIITIWKHSLIYLYKMRKEGYNAFQAFGSYAKNLC